MYAKTCTIAFIAIWLFNASLAAPAPEPEPEAQPDPCGCCRGRVYSNGGNGCSVTKVQTATVSSHIPIKTTHKILGNSDYGCSTGCGGWSNGGCGYGWDSGYGGWDSGCGNNWDGGWGDCVVTRVHHVPVITHVPIKTTHRVLPQSDCGNSGWGTLAGYGNGCGCGCGCNGWL